MSSSESSDSESDPNTSQESVYSEAELSQDEEMTRVDEATKETVVVDDESADNPGQLLLCKNK